MSVDIKCPELIFHVYTRAVTLGANLQRDRKWCTRFTVSSAQKQVHERYRQPNGHTFRLGCFRLLWYAKHVLVVLCKKYTIISNMKTSLKFISTFLVRTPISKFSKVQLSMTNIRPYL